MRAKLVRLVAENGELKSDIYATPVGLFKKFDEAFGFTLDVCANEENHKCDRYYDVKKNGLKRRWDRKPGTANWANIPYSQKREWFGKAHREASKGAIIGLLSTMDSLTNKSFNPEFVSHIFILRGRVKFEGNGATGAFGKGSVLILYNGHQALNLDRLRHLKGDDGAPLGMLCEFFTSSQEEEVECAA